MTTIKSYKHWSTAAAKARYVGGTVLSMRNGGYVARGATLVDSDGNRSFIVYGRYKSHCDIAEIKHLIDSDYSL